MKEQFIPYNSALELKKLGFDEKCFRVWIGKNVLRNEEFKNSDRFENLYICSAPLWQQAFDFFREKYKFDSFIARESISREYFYDISWRNKKDNLKDVQSQGYSQFQEARQACLEKLIEIAQKTVEKI